MSDKQENLATVKTASKVEQVSEIICPSHQMLTAKIPIDKQKNAELKKLRVELEITLQSISQTNLR